MLKRLNAAATGGATVLRKRCCCGAAVRKGCFEYSRGAFRLFAWAWACSRLRMLCLRLMYDSVVVGLRLQRYNKRNGQSYDSVRFLALEDRRTCFFERQKNKSTCFWDIVGGTVSEPYYSSDVRTIERDVKSQFLLERSTNSVMLVNETQKWKST